jgi:AcrR family transcriptional regulator
MLAFAEKEAVRTRMSDIARSASVHRSTGYYYFWKKHALLAASFERVLTATVEAVEQCWQTDDLFLLVAACLRGSDIARSSPTMRSLIEEHQALGAGYHAAEGSELWRAKLADTLVRRLRLLRLPARFAAIFRSTPSPAGLSGLTSASLLNQLGVKTAVTRACLAESPGVARSAT